MKKYKLDIFDYDNKWPNLYKIEKELLTKVIVENGVHFEHIGGTSIPGLAAKPIIDIALGVEDFGIAGQLVEKITALGYNYEPDMEEIYPEFKFLWKGDRLNGSFDLHKFHVSIQSVESDSWNNPILFRNYLRKHPEAAEGYATLKKKLSGKYVTDNTAYTKDKGLFIQSIISKAKQV